MFWAQLTHSLSTSLLLKVFSAGFAHAIDYSRLEKQSLSAEDLSNYCPLSSPKSREKAVANRLSNQLSFRTMYLPLPFAYR